jgi:membrane protease YdiL (CAAX protease family)
VSLRWRQVGAALLAYLAGQGLVWAVAGIIAVSRAGTAAGSARLFREISLLIPLALPASLLAGAIALILVLRRWRQRVGSVALGEVLGLSWGSRRQLVRSAMAGAALALVVLPLVSVLSSSRHPADVTTQLALSSPSAWGAWILSAVLLAPPIEELMFRGAFLGGLAQSWSLRAAAVTSGLTFWLMHGPEFVHWPAAVSIGLLTVLTTTLRLRTRILGPSVAAHFGYNLVIAALVSLALLIRPTGSRWAAVERQGRLAHSGGTTVSLATAEVTGNSIPQVDSSRALESKDRQLCRASKSGRNPGGPDPARHVQRSEGIAIPSLQKPAGADWPDRRQEGKPDLPPVRMAGEKHHGSVRHPFERAFRKDG